MSYMTVSFYSFPIAKSSHLNYMDELVLLSRQQSIAITGQQMVKYKMIMYTECQEIIKVYLE